MLNQEKTIFTIFREANALYGKSLKFLFVATILAFVPVFLFRAFLPPVNLGGLADENLLNLSIFFGIEIIFFTLIVATTVYLASCQLSEETPDFDGLFTAVLPKFPKMIITTLLVGGFLFLLFYFLGRTFFVIIPIYFAVTMIFFQHVIADMGRWGLNAVSLSRFLVRGRWFRTFFTFGLIAIGYIAVFFVMNLLGSTLANALNLGNSPFFHLPFFILTNLLLTYFSLVVAIWYFDIKRLHQQNLEMLEKLIFEGLRQALENMENIGHHDWTKSPENSEKPDQTEENEEKNENKEPLGQNSS
ncbi:MAG: hypothetical protein LBE35_04595 [Clostridiales bacterium]|nr:hypothetical protein [Clostridiales bacterium]